MEKAFSRLRQEAATTLDRPSSENEAIDVDAVSGDEASSKRPRRGKGTKRGEQANSANPETQTKTKKRKTKGSAKT